MYISETNSTNTLLREMIAVGNPPEFIYTGFQTAGRGQAGNGWESERDKNLLCSVSLPPIANLFELNVIVSVALHQLVTHMDGMTSETQKLTIKWPNDIYWMDKKLAGILIENAIVGKEVKYSIAGIGLNVNQTRWLSNAPNPVSCTQITGVEYDVDVLMEALNQEIHKALHQNVWTYYKTHLYRREGYWPFIERDVNSTPTMNADSAVEGQFLAQIEDVLPTGEILLRDQQGKQRKYHFKQIRYVV